MKPDLLVLRGSVDREPLAALQQAPTPVVVRLDTDARGPCQPWAEMFVDGPVPHPAIAADAPVTPIGYIKRTVVCSARLHEAVLSPMTLFDFTRVWIE